uniref:Uncharacterized protein n=1 Tax=Cucumis melo TaxID=3656 RepID=A0A9I9EJ99_CUCME
MRRPISPWEIKAKEDFMAMGGSFEKKRMKMNGMLWYFCDVVEILTGLQVAPTKYRLQHLIVKLAVILEDVLPKSIGAMKPYLRQFIDEHALL